MVTLNAPGEGDKFTEVKIDEATREKAGRAYDYYCLLRNRCSVDLDGVTYKRQSWGYPADGDCDPKDNSFCFFVRADGTTINFNGMDLSVLSAIPTAVNFDSYEQNNQGLQVQVTCFEDLDNSREVIYRLTIHDIRSGMVQVDLEEFRQSSAVNSMPGHACSGGYRDVAKVLVCSADEAGGKRVWVEEMADNSELSKEAKFAIELAASVLHP